MFFFAAKAQVATITDLDTGEPVLATLSSKTPKAFATTNARGQADISAFKDAAAIEIRSVGYQSEIFSYDDLVKNAFHIVLLPAGIELEGVVVSATKWSQAASETPSKIISISPKEVALQNPQTAADLLGVSGKVFIQKSQQGGGSPMIRGFATNRLLYTIDGVRMNTAIFRGGNIQNVISLDPFAIENAEVLFGPGSLIYGSDAIGGVMSFQTLTPQFSANNSSIVTGKALARYASVNHEQTGHFDVNLGWKKWAMTTSLSSNQFDDLRMGGHGPDEYLRPFYVRRVDGVDIVVTNEDPRVQRPSGYSQINLMHKIRLKPHENWDFQYGFHFSETSEYARYDRHIRYKNGRPRYGEWSYGPQKWRMNNLTISHVGRGGLYDEATLRIAKQDFEESRIDRDINQPIRFIRIEAVTAYSANLDFIKSIGERNKLFYGAEWVLNQVASSGIDEDIVAQTKSRGPARYPQADWVSYGVYATDQYKISKAWLLQAGMRYNHFRLQAQFDTTFYPFPFTRADIGKGALTGSVGVVFRPVEQWVVSANAATAFRSPNVDDVGKVFDSEPGAVTVPNPDLQAEYAYNADLSLAHVFHEQIKVDLTAYYTRLDNAMVRRNFTLNGQDSIVYGGVVSRVQAIQNAAKADVYGVQAGLEIKLPGGFRVASDFNYQVGKEELDDASVSPSRHAAPWFGLTKLIYDAHKLNLQWYAVYSGGVNFEDMPVEEAGKPEIYAIDENGNPYSPGWYTLNFKVMYQVSANFAINAGLENITDQRYRPYSSGIVAPGRNFILSARCNF